MRKYILVGLGGALGSVARWMISYLWMVQDGMPLATLSVNLLGSFLLAYLFSRISSEFEKTYLFLATGFLGSFTTFSTFSLELVTLLQDERWVESSVYFLSSSIGGLIFGWMGYKIGRREGV